MKFRLILLLALTSLFAAGCATHQKAPGATFDRIGQEMQGALDAKAKGGADAAKGGFADVTGGMLENPLPDAIIIEPAADTQPAGFEDLKGSLAGMAEVERVQLDSAWVKRFDAFLKLGKLALWMLAGIFAAGLVAVTFNTIRLQVLAQAAEIEVARMIGATDGFIRRPFYYFGALQGALGGLLAAALVIGALLLLAGPVGELAALYGGSFSLRLPGVIEVAALAGIGALLGWLGAQLSVSLSLRKFD